MKCRLKIALLFFFSFLGLLRCYRELLSIEIRPKIDESLRHVKDLPFLPPYFQFPVDYFTAYQYNITTCSIRKSMSQMVFNTMCLLHDPERFLKGNHTISETWESNRTCNYEDEDGFATFPDVHKNSSTFTRIVFIRDPFDRFLSFYLDKCVRKGFCFDCLDDMRCVLENIYKSLREQYLGDIRYVANFIGLHSAPISWFCDFDKYLKAYHIMVIGPGKKEREEPIRRFSEILKKKKVPEKIISKIVKESLSGQTSHGTHNSSRRKIAEQQIKTDPIVREYLHKIYLFDYLIFPFNRSHLDAQYQQGSTYDKDFFRDYSNFSQIQSSYANLLN